jgi:hypothetical protein
MPAGRPPIKWTPELEQTILYRIAHGESVRRICIDPEMPASSSIYEHLIESKEFAEQYARAREAQMEAMSDEILDIADDTSADTKTIKRGDLEIEVENAEWINRCRLQVDTRKWLMSKLAPKKYGDNAKVALSNPDGSALGLTLVHAVPRPERE